MEYHPKGENPMKLEKTVREILVTLSASDQEAFGIRYDTMSFSDLKTRRFCEQTAALICLREGVCEPGSVAVRAAENAAGELLLYFSLPVPEQRRTERGVIEFESVDGLLDSRRAFVPDPNLCAEVYRRCGRYYLWYEFEGLPERVRSFSRALLEYGRRSALDRSYLAEHADPMPEAVALLLN